METPEKGRTNEPKNVWNLSKKKSVSVERWEAKQFGDVLSLWSDFPYYKTNWKADLIMSKSNIKLADLWILNPGWKKAWDKKFVAQTYSAS